MEAIVPKGAEARRQRRQPRDIYRKKIAGAWKFYRYIFNAEVNA